MTGQHARMLAEQDSYGARNVELRKQHTKNQRRECMAWKQRTHNARRQSDGQARWQQSHWAKTAKPNSTQPTSGCQARRSTGKCKQALRCSRQAGGAQACSPAQFPQGCPLSMLRRLLGMPPDPLMLPLAPFCRAALPKKYLQRAAQGRNASMQMLGKVHPGRIKRILANVMHSLRSALRCLLWI